MGFGDIHPEHVRAAQANFKTGEILVLLTRRITEGSVEQLVNNAYYVITKEGCYVVSHKGQREIKSLNWDGMVFTAISEEEFQGMLYK